MFAIHLAPQTLHFNVITISTCRKVTSLRDGHSNPPTDSLLRFLVESSSDEYPSCANCDRNEKSPMFFCNTCGKKFVFHYRWNPSPIFASHLTPSHSLSLIIMPQSLTRSVSVCWSSPRHCQHFLSRVNAAGLALGQVGETAMFYCNTCGKSPHQHQHFLHHH